MKQIIGLYGSGDKGKSETLNLLIDLLEVATTGCPMPTAQKPRTDRKKTFNYNGNIVAISTKGDTEKALVSNCSYFKKKKCDIAISAARTLGITHDKLKNLGETNTPPITVTWIEKEVINPESTATKIVNLAQAEKLFKTL